MTTLYWPPAAAGLASGAGLGEWSFIRTFASQLRDALRRPADLPYVLLGLLLALSLLARMVLLLR